MCNQPTLEQLEEQVSRLSTHEQLKLVAHICEQLSITEQAGPAAMNEKFLQQRNREADKLLALCDEAAEMWEGEFDATEEIRQMRQERDDQLWLNRS